MQTRSQKSLRKPVSPIVAILVIVVVLALVVAAYFVFGKSKRGMQQTEQLKKIQQEIRAEMARSGGGPRGRGGRRQRMGGRMRQATTP